MVIGNGLIAGAFRSLDETYANKYLFFASGVSNSNETRKHEFLREENLIREHRNKQHLVFVYFSTISINDNSKKQSFYIQHKISMEGLVKDLYSKYLIIRLPNVIGSTGNPNTMFNYFRLQVSKNSRTKIQSNAHRYVIDIDDVVGLFVSNKYEENNILTISSPTSIKVLDVYRIIARLLGQEPRTEFVTGGEDYEISLNRLSYDYWEETYPDGFDAVHYFTGVALKYLG